MIIRYLRTHLRFARDDGPDLPLRWVGFELVRRDADYLEVPLPSRQRQLEIHNTLFFELEDGQANTLEVSVPGRRETLTFREISVAAGALPRRRSKPRPPLRAA